MKKTKTASINELLTSKFVLIPGNKILKLISKNVNSKDFDSLSLLWNSTIAQTNANHEPVYPHKKSLVSYYCPIENIRSSGKFTSIEHIDPTTIGDTSYYRIHKAWPIEADNNIILKNIRSFLFDILKGVLNTNNINNFEAMQTAYRVTMNLNTNEDGDPGPEGVHQDSCVVTAISLINRNNLTTSSATNRIWTLEQDYGKSKSNDLISDKLLYQGTLKNPLDTLILLDREVKHEVTSIEPEDKNHSAIRDVLTYEIRIKQNHNIDKELNDEEEKCGQPSRFEALLWEEAEAAEKKKKQGK